LIAFVFALLLLLLLLFLLLALPSYLLPSPTSFPPPMCLFHEKVKQKENHCKKKKINMNNDKKQE